MEEGEAAAAGEQKKKTFPFSRSSRTKPFLGVSIAVSRVSLESSLSREGGDEKKNSLPMAGAKPPFKRESMASFFFSPALTTNPFSLSSLSPLNRRCSSRSSGCKGRSSAAPSPIRARRAAGLGASRRGGLLSVSFLDLFFFGGDDDDCRKRRLRQTTFRVECRVPRSLFASALEFCSLGQGKDVS